MRCDEELDQVSELTVKTLEPRSEGAATDPPALGKLKFLQTHITAHLSELNVKRLRSHQLLRALLSRLNLSKAAENVTVLRFLYSAGAKTAL